MKQRVIFFALALACILVGLGITQSDAQGPQPRAPRVALGTAFTYQGQLKDGGNPANGTYDFQFALYDAASGGTQVGSTVSVNDLTVTNGLFTTQLDFGASAFTGDARYLEIRVRPGSSTGSYTTLSPRQQLTPAPYALALPGLYTQQNATSPNLIGGYSGNSVTSGVKGATIGGGGASGLPNHVTDDYGTVGGGYDNQAGDNAGTPSDTPYATVGGGSTNTASGDAATVGGGVSNTASGGYATVGGGVSNTASGSYATVGGGVSNTASGSYATVGGGYDNTASGYNATVGGGYSNTASGDYATVGGGYSNTASGNYATVGGGAGSNASGFYATVGGGYSNTASGDYSFVVGRRAKNTNTAHDGVFIFADSNNFDFSSTAANQFRVRATGGAQFVSGIDGSGNPNAGVQLAAGGGSWSSISDRAVKENFADVNSREILARVAALPIQTWNYVSQDDAIRHVGPTAQDFYAAFGVGEDDKHITTIDADGVALAAIQGLYQVLQEKDTEIANLQSQNANLQSQISNLEARLAVLERGTSAPSAAFDLNTLGLGILLGVMGLVGYARMRGGS